MSAGSSATTRGPAPDPRLPVRARHLLRARTAWTVPLILASVSPVGLAIDHLFPACTDDKVKALSGWMEY